MFICTSTIIGIHTQIYCVYSRLDWHWISIENSTMKLYKCNGSFCGFCYEKRCYCKH